MEFAELNVLLEQDPAAYRREIGRMREEDPVQLARFVEQVRENLSSVEPEKPLSLDETEDLLSQLGRALGWPRTRVIAEAALRLSVAVYSPEAEDFKPLTPNVDRPPPMRRHSSIRGLVLGDIQLAAVKRK